MTATNFICVAWLQRTLIVLHNCNALYLCCMTATNFNCVAWLQRTLIVLIELCGTFLMLQDKYPKNLKYLVYELLGSLCPLIKPYVKLFSLDQRHLYLFFIFCLNILHMLWIIFHMLWIIFHELGIILCIIFSVTRKL